MLSRRSLSARSRTGAAAAALAVSLSVPFGISAALAQSPEAQALLESAAASCAAYESGVFESGQALTAVELRSFFGAVAAELLDESAYRCSSAASLYCGSGGCQLHLIAEDKVYSWQATGWRLIEWGPDVILLIGRDGGWCGGAGSEVCYEAVVWSGGRPLTVGEEPRTR